MRKRSGAGIRARARATLMLGALGGLLATGVACDSEAATARTDPPRAASFVGSFGAGGVDEDSTGLVLRRVWGGPDVDLIGASVSADGRYLTYIDWAGTGDVMVREVATGAVERVTWDGVWEPTQTAEEVMISPDGQRVAYLWYSKEEEVRAYNSYELRLIERGEREPRLLYRSAECIWPQLWDWSPDGGEILFLAHMKDGSSPRLMTVPAEGGDPKTLKVFDTDLRDRGVFSPQGDRVVYAVPQGSERPERDLFMLELETGEVRPLVRNPGDDYLLGWSPDGDHVLFASDRSGSLGAWLQPMEHGRAAGAPVMVKADLWRAEPVGFSADGSYFFGISLGSRKVYVASLDPGTGRVLSPPTPVSGDRVAEEVRPRWSPDGRYLAYETLERSGSRYRLTIVIWDVETGERRQLSPDLVGFGPLLWNPDGRSLLVAGRDAEGDALFDVDIGTGEARPRSWPQRPGDLPLAALIDWGRDGSRVFFRKPAGNGILALDAGAVQPVGVFDQKIGYFPGLSPDGRQLAFAANADGIPALMVMPSTGGEPRVLHRFEGPDSIRGVELIRGIVWSRDARTLVYARVGSNRPGFWKIPAAGGTPELIALQVDGSHPNSIRSVRLHPDGHRIAFDIGESFSEVWVMEDFLPEQEAER